MLDNDKIIRDSQVLAESVFAQTAIVQTKTGEGAEARAAA